MIFTFVVAVIAGLATPMAEPHIKTALESLMLDELKIAENEFRAFSFAIMLVLASILAALGGGGSALGLALGGVAGLFGKRTFEALRSKSSGA